MYFSLRVYQIKLCILILYYKLIFNSTNLLQFFTKEMG
nr:MAG TPA: hypothetical protein [Caudoviricetes sp.]